ncbi:MAG: MerR family transcriptional regulator [Propionibacteriaceae bacterium]|nr:MerR family transcriptional regulator [Propionibacteriaceae bacterium]
MLGSRVGVVHGHEREADMEKAMQIGEVAELTGMSFRTLRHYDEVGLLSPSARSQGGFRLYAPEDLDQLLVIRRMKPLGFSLDEMLQVRLLTEKLKALPEPDADLQAELDDMIAEAHRRREKLERNLGWADEFIGILEGFRAPQGD